MTNVVNLACVAFFERCGEMYSLQHVVAEKPRQLGSWGRAAKDCLLAARWGSVQGVCESGEKHKCVEAFAVGRTRHSSKS